MIDLTAALIALLIAAGALPPSMQPGGGSGSAHSGTAGSACDTARDRRSGDGALYRLKENATSDEGADPEADSGGEGHRATDERAGAGGDAGRSGSTTGDRPVRPRDSAATEPDTPSADEDRYGTGTDRERSARPYDVDEHRYGTDAEAERSRTPSGSDRKGSDQKGSDQKGSDQKGSDQKGSDQNGSDGDGTACGPATERPGPTDGGQPRDRGSGADRTADPPDHRRDTRPTERPADLLDLDNWYLTLPVGAPGDPETVHQPRLSTFSSGDFELNAEGDGVVFTANAGGATTRNSKNPRSELREMDGGQEASWSNNAGTHALSVREAVTELPPVKPHMVTAQIHDGDDDVLQVRLEDKRLMVRYADGAESVTIDPDYRLGAVFDIDIVAGDAKVDVYYNSDLVTGLPLSGEGWYFKSGAYLQSNVEKGEQADALGKVEIYALAVRHSA